jgi:hypothetical protein
MSSEKKQCPECRAEMVEGFILDMSHSGRFVSRWVAGLPEKSMWTGVKIKGKECRLVDTYRCVKCGLLRSYATTEVDSPWVW